MTKGFQRATSRDIAAATGKAEWQINRARRNGEFDPNDIVSVSCYVTALRNLAEARPEKPVLLRKVNQGKTT